MPLQDYQMSYRGVTFNDDTYHITRVDGLEGNSMRMGDRDFPQSHGQIPGRHVAKAKTITLHVLIVGEPGTRAYMKAVRKLKAAISPDYYPGASGLTDSLAFDSSLAHNEQDKLRFKFRGDKERFIRARPSKSSIPMRTHNQFGAQDCVIQFKAVDPRTYSDDKYTASNESQNGQVSQYQFSINHEGFSHAYPRIRLQYPRVSSSATNRQQISITNFGSKDPSGLVLAEKQNPDNYVCKLQLNNLLDVSPTGFPPDHTDPQTLTEPGHPPVVPPAYFYQDRWSNANRPTASSYGPDFLLAKEEVASSIIYTCDMQHYINGNDEYVIWRNSYRLYKNGNTISDLATASDDVTYIPALTANEYRKWQSPRKPFVLLPGTNHLFVYPQYAICDLSWRDTDL